MAKIIQNRNLRISELAGKLLMLIPHFPRIVKKAKVINPNSKLSLGMVIESKGVEHGNVVALNYEYQSYTYLEFNQIINRYANYLFQEGIKRVKLSSFFWKIGCVPTLIKMIPNT